MGWETRSDAAASIDAQAHLMRDLLRQFGSVALALAAYNAGPGAVGACGCVPPYPETQAYVAWD
jgi:soluble lytic murein transglycosylase-like protein